MDAILKEITAKNFKSGEIVHDEAQPMNFMGVIFVGSV